MTLAQRFLYKLGFNQARWFRRRVGGQWARCEGRIRLEWDGRNVCRARVFVWRQSVDAVADYNGVVEVEDYRTLPIARVLDN